MSIQRSGSAHRIVQGVLAGLCVALAPAGTGAGEPSPGAVAAVGKGSYSPPVPVVQAPVEYPPYARTKGFEGRLRLILEVSRTGNVRSVEVKKSTAHWLLEDAAVEAAEKWLFRPATMRDVPVKSFVEVPIRFRLSEGPRSYPGTVRLR